MNDDICSKKAKKLVRWHDNYVVFVTPEAKALGWSDNTIVTVSVIEEKGERKIIIEKGMDLFSLYKPPPRKDTAGHMGWTLHYRTKEKPGTKELKSIKLIKRNYNTSFGWSREHIKLWSSAPRGALWGFTKVSDEQEARVVILAIKEMSRATPRLTWLLYDEGGLTDGRWVILRRGRAMGTHDI